MTVYLASRIPSKLGNLKFLYASVIERACYLYAWVKGAQKNTYSAPQVQKIILNYNIGLPALQYKNLLQKCIGSATAISGQHPKIVRAKNTHSSFKIKKKTVIGLVVTLRRSKMYDFIEKLAKLVFPQMEDFIGLPIRKFDSQGNFKMGFKTQLAFYETVGSDPMDTHGLDVACVIPTRNTHESIQILKDIGLPFFVD